MSVTSSGGKGGSGKGRRSQGQEKSATSPAGDSHTSNPFIIGSPATTGSSGGNEGYTGSGGINRSASSDVHRAGAAGGNFSSRSGASGLSPQSGSSSGGYGATLEGDPYYRAEDDDDERDALLRPAAASILATGNDGTSGVATATTAAPVSATAQQILARAMAARALTEKKNVVGGPTKNTRTTTTLWCGCNMVAALVLVLVLAAVAVFGVIFYSTAHSNSSTEVTAAKPHIIFLLADDLGWNSIGYEDYDLSFATPTLTGLAQQGIIMNNYYAQEFSMIMPTTAWGLHLNETTLAEVLQNEGYKTHALGKWHLGHYSPRYLPTARGFDSFTGYLSGENYYWSKKNPDHVGFVDMMVSDKDCYSPYLEDDLHDYSTFLYRDKAIGIIEDHDASESLFLYVAFQAVHDPFNDINHHSKGLPKEYLADGVYDQIRAEVVGHKRRQYAMALSVMDGAVQDIYTALEAKGILDNTYIVFSSDNGGCYLSGGKNGPLRGSKGSLFEGGLKVDGFIYSASSAFIPEAQRGTRYENLMHISDWFPTLLELAGVKYVPEDGCELDGVSHASNWFDSYLEAPREYMLYNYYYAVTDEGYNKWTNGSFAVRNKQYKLMHTFDSTSYGNWWDGEDTLDNDDSLAEATCSQALSMTGEYTYYLFDLTIDPYETTNLYHESPTDYYEAKMELYAVLSEFEAKARAITVNVEDRNKVTPVIWKAHGDYIVPWVDREDLSDYEGQFPEDCYKPPTHEPTRDPSYTPEPTSTPTTPSPTLTPSEAPTPTSDYDAPPSPPTELPTTFAPTTRSPTTAKPTEAPTGGSDNTPTWFTPTVGVPTMGVPTIDIAPSLMVVPTSPGSPTTLPIVADGPTYPPTAGRPTSLTSPTSPTWNWPTWSPVAPSPEPTDASPTPEPSAEPTAEPSAEPTETPTAEPTKKNDDDWYQDDKIAPTHEPTKTPDDDDWDDDTR